MKLIQQIAILQEQVSTNSTTAQVSRGYLKFFPARYSGIASILFEAVGYMGSGANTGKIELYDLTNAQVLATLTVSGTGIAQYSSADIKASLTANTELVVRYYRTTGGSADYVYLQSVCLTVLQDYAESGKKTATHYGMQVSDDSTTSNSYTGAEYTKRKVYPGSNNGTVKCYLEAYLWSSSTGRSYARLYDYTAGAAVANSEISVQSTTPTYAISAELTLVDGHYYAIQYKNGTSGMAAYHNECHITITAEGFTQCTCIPVSFDYGMNIEQIGWRSQDIKKYYGTNMDADTKAFKWLFNASMDDWSSEADEHFRMIRSDNSGVITDSLITVAYIPATTWLYEEGAPTLPDEDIFLEEQNDLHYGMGENRGFIIAILTEANPTFPFFPPDPGMPAGYHCFMSNFLKNVTANYRPLATPDGANRLY